MSNKRNSRKSNMVTPKTAGVRPVLPAGTVIPAPSQENDVSVNEPIANEPETAMIPVHVENFDVIDEDTVGDNESENGALLEKGDLIFDSSGKIVEVTEATEATEATGFNDDLGYVVENDFVGENSDIESIEELHDAMQEVLEPDMLFILRRLEFLILSRDDVQRDLDGILFSGKPKRGTPERIFMKSLQHEKKFLQKEMQFLVSNLIGSNLDRQVIKRAVLNAGKNEYSV